MARQNFEQTGLAGRLKEYGVLYIFILLAGVVSLAVMNALVFPVAVAAVKKPAVFSAVVKWGLVAALAGAVIMKVISTVRRWAASDRGVMTEFTRSLRRRGSSLLFGLIVIASAALLAVGMYLLLTYNYYLLYEILN